MHQEPRLSRKVYIDNLLVSTPLCKASRLRSAPRQLYHHQVVITDHYELDRKVF